MARPPVGKQRVATPYERNPFGSSEAPIGQWTRSPMGFEGPASLLATFRQASRFDNTVTYGDTTYREIDNGVANVLVPVRIAGLPVAEYQGRQRNLERLGLIADSSLGGGAYAIASLIGASQPTRDAALLAGVAADTLSSSFATGLPVRRPRPASRAELAGLASERPIYREANASGQARGVTAIVTKAALGTGSKPDSRITPPGWKGNGRLNNQARGHLLGNQLGGDGKDLRNLATTTQTPTNNSDMKVFENDVARQAREGEVIDYSVTPLYQETDAAPTWILMSANGSHGTQNAKLVRNPAGSQK